MGPEWFVFLVVGLPIDIEVPVDDNATEVQIVALYPNPVARFDRGEFIVVYVPDEQYTDEWRFLDDGVQSAKPPPVRVEGFVAFSHHPERAREYLDMPVYPLDGWMQLADAGDSVTLVIDDEPVDTVAYDGPAPRARLWVRGIEPDPWVPVGATDIAPVSDRADIEAFVLPDRGDRPLAFLQGATDRLVLGGYTLTDDRVVDAVLAAADRGVSVAVHVEGRPVGGITEPMGAALDRLDEAGVDVTLHRGPYARWGFHHPKYAIVDDAVLVTTENWKPAGTGGNASRGWGVIVESPTIADALVDLFTADTTWWDAYPWAAVRDDLDRHPEEVPTRQFPDVHGTLEADGIKATLIVAPDHAEAVLLEELAGATRSIDIKQVRVADAEFPLMRAAVDAAREGVTVRILLSSAWYVAEENAAVAAALNELAAAEGIDLEVRLDAPDATYHRLHAKGIIVDGERVVVSSINWNNHSLRQNREVGILLEGEAVGAYFTAVFEADWGESSSMLLPGELLLVTLIALAGLAMHAWRLDVEGPDAAEEEQYTDR